MYVLQFWKLGGPASRHQNLIMGRATLCSQNGTFLAHPYMVQGGKKGWTLCPHVARGVRAESPEASFIRTLIHSGEAPYLNAFPFEVYCIIGVLKGHTHSNYSSGAAKLTHKLTITGC
jgi:hypothetical protein